MIVMMMKATVLLMMMMMMMIMIVIYRLNTIMDSDKVLVMDNGAVGEFDTPSHLLADDRSMFYSLVTNWENSH